MGNTFGATALSSYGGFWIAYAIALTPGFGALEPYSKQDSASVLGFFLTGWFIFTFILLLCTLRSTVMFFLLFFTLDLAFLMLACGEFAKSNGAAGSAVRLTQAGGGFGILAAFLAWYNAFAGIADSRFVPYRPRLRCSTVIANPGVATLSSSSPSSTSPGLRRAERCATTRLSARPSRFSDQSHRVDTICVLSRVATCECIGLLAVGSSAFGGTKACYDTYLLNMRR